MTSNNRFGYTKASSKDEQSQKMNGGRNLFKILSKYLNNDAEAQKAANDMFVDYLQIS